MLKESPFFSVITILGTALAICMIMVMVIVFEIQNKGFKPELNRDRTLYVKDVAITHKNEEDGGMNYSLVGGRVAKECFFTLKTPEAVSMHELHYQEHVQHQIHCCAPDALPTSSVPLLHSFQDLS